MAGGPGATEPAAVCEAVAGAGAQAAVASCAPRPAISADVGEGPLNVRGMEILAPMVRACTAPLRWECLRYGADLVFGEEIIDRKIIGAVRVENPSFGLVDYVSPREQVAVFSTRPEERRRLIFQLGTANAALATEAALTVCRDVRGIDINMGCPKSFSVKGGMGAALLEKPEVAADILKTLRRNLPTSCSLTCKIRMLANTEKTRDFMRICEASGAEAITVHMRKREERPAEPAHWDEIVRLWEAVKVPVVANGDFFSRRQIDEFWKLVRTRVPQPMFEEPATVAAGPVAVMVARGALWNPAIFCRTGEAPPFEDVIKRFAEASVASNCSYQNTKWVLSQMLAGGIGVTPPTAYRGVPMKQFNRQVGAAKTMGAICSCVGVAHEATGFPAGAHTTVFYRTGAGKALFDAAGGGAEPPPAGAIEEGCCERPPQPPECPSVAGAGFPDEGDRKRARLSLE